MNAQVVKGNLHHSPLSGIIRAALIATAVVTLLVLAFTWPTKTVEAKDLPVSISGPSEMKDQLKTAVNEQSDGAVKFIDADNRDDAVQQIKERETYGAIVLSEDAPAEVLTAPAANTATSNMLSGVAQQITVQTQSKIVEAQAKGLSEGIEKGKAGIAELTTGIDKLKEAAKSKNPAVAGKANAQLEQMEPKLAEAQTKVTKAEGQLELLKTQGEQREKTTAKVTSVVDLSEDDATGAGLSVASFPLVMAGMLGGIMMLTLVQGVWARLAASTIYAVLSGLLLTLILHTWFGFLLGNFGLLWLAFIVSGLATSFFIIGVGSLLGFGAGMGIGAGVTMLFGNPLSGATSPWEYLLKPWGAIGQHLVPGASNRLLRSLSYFPDASTAPQWITLLLWILGGLVLAIAGYAVAKKNKEKAEPVVVEV